MIPWLARLDLAQVEELIGANALDVALTTPRAYVDPPSVEDQRIVAVLMETPADKQGNPRLSTPIKVSLRVVTTQSSPSRLDTTCAVCRSSSFAGGSAAGSCEHAKLLLVDLAIHESLREVLLSHAGEGEARGEGEAGKGKTRETMMLELPLLRGMVMERRTLGERLAAWLPPRAMAVESDFDLDIEAVVVPGNTATAEGPRSALLLFHRRPGSRALVPAREVLASNLLPKRRRIVDLTAPFHGDKNALVATRGQASIVIHLLREEINARLRFPQGEVKPRVDHDHETGRLIARWYQQPVLLVAEAAEAFVFAGPFPYLWVPKARAFYAIAADVDLEVAMGMQRVPSLPLPLRGDQDDDVETANTVGRALLLKGRGRGVALPRPEVFGLPPLIAPSFELRLSGTPLDVRAELLAVYGANDNSNNNSNNNVFKVSVDDLEEGEARDVEAERAAIAMIERAGIARDERAFFYASEDRAIALWSTGLATLRASTEPRFNVLLSESVARSRIGPPVELDLRVQTTAGWLDTELEFRAKALRVEIEQLHKALAAGKKWVVLSDGSLSRIAEDVAALLGGDPGLLGKMKLPPHQFGRIARWIELADGAGAASIHLDIDPAAIDLQARLRNFANASKLRLPKSLNATLRPYQRAGVAWLQLLREIGVGGLLADDMGLGKTLMTLTFIAAALEGETKAPPTIVVCPTSVASNWIREAKAFVPDLRVVQYTGHERKKIAALLDSPDYDLIVTTYGIMRRDIDKLTRAQFQCVVLDEAQNIKNPASDTARCARRLGANAKMRIALTGTPVENRLSELWSLMTFVNPGMLGTAGEFDARYERPITNFPNGAVAAELRSVVRPFVLRRTKNDVLNDLPAKTEIDLECVFGMKQKRLYDALALTMRQAMAKNLEKRDGARTQLSALTAILRLRQMACDPRLVDPSLSDNNNNQLSAKRAAFLELVRELVAEDRRALVFSQFVELFTLWRADLDAAKVRYEYLDGSTTPANRQKAVDRFQNGDAPLFLISLKAGGAGLNLTAADTVIHIDPWWNPATEDQATDRAHRIGQTRAVTVIRLVAQGTIEDKLLLLKKHKQDLANAVSLTDEDVALLLGDAETVLDEEEEEEGSLRSENGTDDPEKWTDRTTSDPPRDPEET